ncbi:MAG: hypothetical protein K2K46_13070 [Lachnospiraceae bacterium]|nr:hypothetical protein [Lachnospiraceae bacterium]
MSKFEAGTLESYFSHLRDGMTDISMVFNKIEGRDISSSDIPDSIAKKFNAKDIFYKSYIIVLVQSCCNEQDSDLLLMMCGFLQGYEQLNITKRRQEYCDNIGIHDEKNGMDQTLAEHWHNKYVNIKSSMYSKENNAVSQLVKILKERGDNPDYISKAKESVNNPYPVPNYLRGDGHGYRKCEVEGKVFYVPLTEEERRTQANISDKSGKWVDTLLSLPIAVGIALTAIRESMKKSIEYLKMRCKIINIIVILLIAFIVVIVWKNLLYKKNKGDSQPYIETTTNTSITESRTPAIEYITIHNANITLTPDKPWEKLKVTIYPREANIEDVNYFSDNNKLVTINRMTEIIQLASEWHKETDRRTNVHVQCGEIDENVPVNVREHTVDDGINVPTNSNLDGNDSNNVENVSGF